MSDWKSESGADMPTDFWTAAGPQGVRTGIGINFARTQPRGYYQITSLLPQVRPDDAFQASDVLEFLGSSL
eukprot:3695059-Rhodomonas_salina.2